MKKITISTSSQVIGTLLFAAILLGILVFFVSVFSAERYKAPVRLDRNYDRSAMQEALSPEAVQSRFNEISAIGSRTPGQQGLEDAEAMISAAYRDAGLEVLTQDVMMPTPLTDGGSGILKLANTDTAITLWSFMPNYVQPVTTSEGGLTGKLFLATEQNVRAEKSFSDKIAVIDTSLPVFKDLEFNAAQYKELGFQAVIVTHTDGLDHVPWSKLFGKMTSSLMPVNIIRFAAEPEILKHIGESVTVENVTRWVKAETRNVIGVMRTPGGSDSALIIPVTYDAASILPDHSVGEIQALQTALQLQLIKGLTPHQGSFKRDVIFVAATGLSQSQYGLSRLISTIGRYGKADHERERIISEQDNNEQHITMLKEIEALFASPDFMSAGKSAETEAAIKALPTETRKFFMTRTSSVMRKAVFEQAEILLNAEIAYKRNPDDLNSKEYHAFRNAKKLYDDLNNISALPAARTLERPLAEKKVFALADGTPALIRDALKSHINYLLDYHDSRTTSILKDLALQKLFASYKNLLVISPRVQPSLSSDEHETIGYASGYAIQNGESANLFRSMLNDAVYALGIERKITIQSPKSDAFRAVLGSAHLDSGPFAVVSQPAFSIVNPQNSANSCMYPVAQAVYTNLTSVKLTMQILGETVISASRGYGIFSRLPFMATYSMHGSVYASGIGNSVVPNYTVANALVASLDEKPKTFTDPYGDYNMPFLTMPNLLWLRYKAPEAFFFDLRGNITHVKDYGATAQFIYSSTKMPTADTPVNLILYRATPVAILNVVNPQSMKSFSGIEFISRSGLSAFSSVCPYNDLAGMMDFISPKEYFFLTLKAGAPGNDLVAQTRAFCLGVSHNSEPHYKPSDNEIDGAGYLALDTPFFTDIASECTTSMEFLSDKRLKLQTRYGMADEMTLKLNSDAKTLLDNDVATGSSTPLLSRLRKLRQALSYLILNHPVIRNSVSEAVWGILWYMGLLVPFIFFFEKLMFGFTDIRKQLMAQGGIFLIVFALLRILHPAFHMIRSSAMILLGFVIIIIVGSVTLVLSSKFQENLDALRKSQGGVKGVSGNKMGIIMTAFMLGLNNMHKRKVRTGLTCATLVLMTFVMICFTSVQSNIVEKERAIGKAAYQGILVREKQFRPISASEIDALNASYGEHNTVNVREAFIGRVDLGQNKMISPNFNVVVGTGAKKILRVARVGLGFNYTEPLAKSIKMLTTNGWFTAEQAALTQPPYPLIIPDTMANQMGIFPEDVNKEPIQISVKGVPFYVWGIFDSSEIANVRDVDGEDLMPFDIEAITSPQFIDRTVVIAEQTDPRVQPSDMIIGLCGQLPGEVTDGRIVSAVVDMGNAPYKEAREEINAYLVQTGRDTNYGLDGTAFNGRRARVRSMAGMADLLIPLIIAALTVLNTMKGSVYERHDEIFVYNAVGIAPRYVFFMFVAEALVYSVVGAVLGYILSQGTGRILTAFNWTGGMNMNFTSLSTVYASLAIAAATIASTYFPARSAMEIAKPTEDAGWTLPKPTEDDTLTIVLPFTFTHCDRIAVLAFFYQYFENHGEGSAGPFFAGIPKLTLADHTDPLANDAYIPSLDVQVWLKPFDLGVSQRITIELGTDPDTKEFISVMKLARVTGTRDAWIRLNKPLVALIRQHFLHWRAVPEETKAELFTQAKNLLEETVLGSAKA